MVKLVILIEALEDSVRFEADWPQFLYHAERMPGLTREASSQVDFMLYGAASYIKMHELFFDSSAVAQQAMSSLHGQAAGRVLQQITGGKLALFFVDYKEDTIENIRRYQFPKDEAERDAA
jgi:hypothetical protein